LKQSLLGDVHFRFLRLLTILEASPTFPHLDSVERRLLEFIAMHESNGRGPLVSETIYSSDIGSPATLHRRIAVLKKHELLRYGDDIDGRKKYLELTPKAKNYFAELWKCILKSTKVT
jgi:DNA-binding MarR family transcriptional regulator